MRDQESRIMNEKQDFSDAASRDDRGQSGIDHSTATSTADPKDENDYRNYPPRKVVVPAVAAIYLTIFLIALVSDTLPNKTSSKPNTTFRIEPFLELPSRPLRTNSTPLATQPGTRQATCFPFAHSSSHLAAYTHITLSNGSWLHKSQFLKSGRLSAPRHKRRMP